MRTTENTSRAATENAEAPSVAVTGIGIVCSAGIGVEQYWASVLAGESGLRSRRAARLAELGDRFYGEVDDDLLAVALRSAVGEEDAQRCDRVTAMTTVAAHEALKDAGVVLGDHDLGRVGLIVGKCQPEYTGDEETDDGKHSHTECEQLADHLGLRGPIMTIATACTAGTNAIGVARDKLWCDEADLMLAGGVDTLLQGTIAGFTGLQALSDDGCAPYSRSDGLTLGEGAAFLVLERLEAAERRGATVHALVLGYGLSADAYHPTAPDPMGRGAVLSINRALKDAAVEIGEVDYVNGHGTGTPTNDAMERRVMRTLFGDGATVPISSTKSIVGHTLGAAGAVEAVTCALALEHGVVPPTLNCAEPVARVSEQEFDCVPNQARPAVLDVVVSNSYAFGGNNATVILGKAGHVRRQPRRARRRVAITGIGIVGSLGIGIDDWRKALRRGEPGVRRIESFLPDSYRCQYAAEVDQRFASECFASQKDWRQMDALTRQSLAAARFAMEDAGFDPTGPVRTDTGVFLGTAYGPATTALSLVGGASENPKKFAQASLNAPTGLVCKILGLRGPTTTIAGADVSGTLALATAVTAIQLGHADVIIIIAGDEFSERMHRGHDRYAGLLAEDGVVRPYDAARTGTVLGETVVALVVESVDFAMNRSARPYCEIVANSHGVVEGSAPLATQAGAYADSIRTALARAGRDGGEIEYCVGAAAGGPLDVVELDAVVATLDHSFLSAPKSLTGDCRAASGALNVAVAALGISDGLIVPTANLSDPIGGDTLALASNGNAPVNRVETAIALDSWHGISFGATVLARLGEGSP